MSRWQATTQLRQKLRVVAVLSVVGLAELVVGLVTGLAAAIAVGGSVVVGGLIFCVLAVTLPRRRR